MRLLFAFNGTRGDIQPAVVVADELRRRGHDAVFGVPPNMFEFAERLGLDARPFGYDTREHINSDLVRRRLRTGSPRQRLQALAELRDFGWDQMVAEMASMSGGADAIVSGFTTEQIALNYAESMGVPLITLHHAPILANSYVSPMLGGPPLPEWLTRWSWRAYEAVVWRLTRGRENRLRGSLGLAEATTSLSDRLVSYGTVQLQAYDRAFVPSIAAEWGDNRPFVGFLGPSAEQRRLVGEDAGLDAELRDWIADGTPPIYFGFGSMPVPRPDDVFDAITSVCRELGERALISLGWNDDAMWNGHRDDHHVRLIGQIDHDQVFPLCKAVVHHGGAGTTAAAIRAGRSAMVCAVSADQPFWGAQLERLGIGASSTLAELDSTRLSNGLAKILRDDTRHRARVFAERLTGPDAAVRAAADSIEREVFRRRGDEPPRTVGKVANL